MARNAVEADTVGEVVESPTLRSSVAVLDGALDRVSALDFEIPNPFLNHAPMACEALAALGLDSVIDEWVERYETLMGQAVPPVTPIWQLGFDWKEFLGDYRLLPEWMGYFDQAIDDEGWRAVIGVWVPRLMPGLAAALFHGVIRTSHAVRAIEVADTEARRAELARALGNWAVWFAPGQPVDQGAGFDDPQRSALQAAAHGARCYVADPDIFNLHGVTGAMAVHLLAGHLALPDARAAVVQLQAEHRSLYRGVAPIAAVGEGYWNDQTVRDASKSYDAHQIKLVEACLRGFRLTGDPGSSRAAEMVTSSAD
jgi:Questin oxidase-like